MKKTTITIGIPAYNEEANIVYLIKSLLKQKLVNASITKIYVISDSSTDKTVEKAKGVKDLRLVVLNNASRKGKTYILNSLFKKSKNDFLVVLDADVVPASDNFIQELIMPALNKKQFGLTGANTVSLKAKNYFEKVIETSHRFKNTIYSRENKGDNIYLCHGRARAFAKNFYKKLRIPNNVPEDAYSYLICKKLGYQFLFVPKAIVLFKSPSKLADHMMQSMRFSSGKEILSKYFSQKDLNESYKLSMFNVSRVLAKFFIQNPMTISIFILIKVYARLFVNKENINHKLWNIARSSKKLYIL